MTFIRYRSIIESHGTLSLIFSPSLSIHPIQSRLMHYFDAYTIGLVSYWKVEPISRGKFQFLRPRMGRFFNRFTGKNQFLFHKSKLFYHGIQYPRKYHPPLPPPPPPNSRWEVRQIKKIAHSSVKHLITLTCRNS